MSITEKTDSEDLLPSPFLQFHDLYDRERIPVYRKTYVKTRVVEAVAALRGVLVTGPGVEGEHFKKRPAPVFGDHAKPFVGEDYPQWLIAPRFGERVGRIRMAVGLGEIGLDIKDRRAVDQIRACHVQHGPVRRAQFNV